MKWRRVAVALVAVAAVVTAIAAFWPSPRPGRATFLQVRQEMTREEVIAIVGRPADGVTNRFHDQGSTLWIGCDQWVGDDCTLDVYFDPAGRASWVKVDPRPAEPSLFRRLCARAGL